MDGWQAVYEARERTVALLEQAAAGRLDPASAADLLSDLRAMWSRERRWRNTAPPVLTLHVAGPVIDSRTYVRSCPRYIVDRRQACGRCGVELIRGRWAVFFAEGQLLAATPGRAPILNVADADTVGLHCEPPIDVHPRPVRADKGAPPYGFEVVAGELRPVEDECHVVGRMRALRGAGRSYRDIADELNRDQIPARRGGRWHAMTVRRALARHAVTTRVPPPADNSAVPSPQEIAEESGVEMPEETP